jgi:prolyl-tRNA editing enzyme YbaK/EbsC (Cys-tRNA(Pro) deacylase)
MTSALSNPAIQKVIEAAARKGVALDIRLLPGVAYTAQQSAVALEAELGQIVRAVVLVAVRAGGRLAPVVCLVSGQDEVDLGLLAAVSGEVALRHASARETRELTGYPRSGSPPFGYARDVRIVMDRQLGRYRSVWAAAGTDAAFFRVSPRTLQMLSNALVLQVAEEQWTQQAINPGETQLGFGAGAGA